MSKTDLERLALNAKLGDGCIAKRKDSYGMSFSSVSLDYLSYKRSMAKVARPASLRTQVNGGYSRKYIHRFSVRSTIEAKEAYALSNSEAIQRLDKVDLCLWMFDDGSLHKQHGTMHLYSNMLNEVESKVLIAKIFELYPVEKGRLSVDRKKDGRSFFYIYIPRVTAEVIQVDMLALLTENNIDAMQYKTVRRKYTLNDHRTANSGRRPKVGPATILLEPSRVGE